MEEEFLRVPEIAQVLRVDGCAVRQWIRGGALPAIELPHRGKRAVFLVKKHYITALTGENIHMSELLTVAEVARILRVDDTTVRRWVKQGSLEAVILPHVNARQAYRIKRESIDAVLAGSTARQPEPESTKQHKHAVHN